MQEHVRGEAWAAQFQRLPHLEQLTCAGGKALASGVTLLNAARQEQNRQPVLPQGDHGHAFRPSGPGLRKAPQQAAKALAAAERAQQELLERQRQGRPSQGASHHARVAWRRAEQAFDTWSQQERSGQQTKDACGLLTADGELNTRARATEQLATLLPQLPDAGFAQVKRSVQRPELLNYLDQVQERLAALPFAPEVTAAAVRQEALRRRPERAQGEGLSAAAVRGVLLLCAVTLAQAGAAGKQAVASVPEIVRGALRASSLVECINSVLRMQQARHRRLTQGLQDLKRLYGNSHEFRTGRRWKQSPYQLLGVPWPEGLRWWDVLKLTPEQLQEKLSTVKQAA